VPGFEGASAFARLDHHAAAHRLLVNCGCLCAHRIVCVQHVACLHADADRCLPAARTGVFAKPCGVARATDKAHESAQQTSMSVVSSVLGRRLRLPRLRNLIARSCTQRMRITWRRTPLPLGPRSPPPCQRSSSRCPEDKSALQSHMERRQLALNLHSGHEQLRNASMATAPRAKG
jgi:hypothetical protein